MAKDSELLKDKSYETYSTMGGSQIAIAQAIFALAAEVAKIRELAEEQIAKDNE